jgi:hypothetical protein
MADQEGRNFAEQIDNLLSCGNAQSSFAYDQVADMVVARCRGMVQKLELELAAAKASRTNDLICIHHNDEDRANVGCPVCLRNSWHETARYYHESRARVDELRDNLRAADARLASARVIIESVSHIDAARQWLEGKL